MIARTTTSECDTLLVWLPLVFYLKLCQANVFCTLANSSKHTARGAVCIRGGNDER